MSRTKEEYENAVSKSLSIASVCRILGIAPTGGNYRIVHKAIKEYGLDTSHFTGQGWNVGMKFRPKETTDIKDILVKGSYYQSFKLKNRLLKKDVASAADSDYGETNPYHWNFIISMVITVTTGLRIFRFYVQTVTR